VPVEREPRVEAQRRRRRTDGTAAAAEKEVAVLDRCRGSQAHLFALCRVEFAEREMHTVARDRAQRHDGVPVSIATGVETCRELHPESVNRGLHSPGPSIVTFSPTRRLRRPTAELGNRKNSLAHEQR
jgi:hypothetical protein